MFIHIFCVVCLFQNVFIWVRRHLFLSLISNLNKNLLIDSSAQRSGSTDFSKDYICNHWHKTIPNWIESSSEKKYDDTSSTKHALYIHRNNFYFWQVLPSILVLRNGGENNNNSSSSHSSSNKKKTATYIVNGVVCCRTTCDEIWNSFLLRRLMHTAHCTTSACFVVFTPCSFEPSMSWSITLFKCIPVDARAREKTNEKKTEYREFYPFI